MTPFHETASQWSYPPSPDEGKKNLFNDMDLQRQNCVLGRVGGQFFWYIALATNPCIKPLDNLPTGIMICATHRECRPESTDAPGVLKGGKAVCE
jgi:hypothetical protein